MVKIKFIQATGGGNGKHSLSLNEQQMVHALRQKFFKNLNDKERLKLRRHIVLKTNRPRPPRPSTFYNTAEVD